MISKNQACVAEGLVLKLMRRDMILRNYIVAIRLSLVSNSNSLDNEYKLETNLTNTNTYAHTHNKLNNLCSIATQLISIHPVTKNSKSSCCLNILTRELSSLVTFKPLVIRLLH